MFLNREESHFFQLDGNPYRCGVKHNSEWMFICQPYNNDGTSIIMLKLDGEIMFCLCWYLINNLRPSISSTSGIIPIARLEAMDKHRKAQANFGNLYNE